MTEFDGSSQSVLSIGNTAFADALQRARQIAAKINTPGSNSNSTGGTKRPLDDGSDNPLKKMATLTDPIGAQLAALQQQARLGLGGGFATEEIRVPDKMVGVIIGRGGEQINRLQAESGCKIQMAPDSGGLPDRQCSLTGSKAAIDKAKDLIVQIVSRGGGGGLTSALEGPSDGQHQIEMMIPAPKVGLIIGKGGETIKNLQDRAGVKMVMIQDGPFQHAPEKPLRITGEPQKCEYARQLVNDLLTEKELEVGAGVSLSRQGRGFGRNDYGGQTVQEIEVPRQAVGVIIGKGGEMIKKIQGDSGARVQFQNTDDNVGDRTCVVSGGPEQVQQAQAIIHELISSVMARDSQQMGRGRGRGRGGFDGRGPPHGDYMGGGGPGMGRGGPMGRGGGGPDHLEIQFTIPAAKCGIVIGRGGENIRNINQQCGAHVELSRQPPANPNEKVFTIRGTPQQIEHAKHLISEKIGMMPQTNAGYGSGAPPGVHNGPPDGYQPNAPPGPQPPQAGFAPQGWGNAYQQWQNQGGSDPSADANAAAWAAYYAQYSAYNQQPQQQAAGSAPAPNSAPAQPAMAPAPSHQQPAQPSAAAPAQGGQGAQPDYSAAWAEYYRSMGMFKEAEVIEQQARANQAGGSAAQPSQPAVSAASAVSASPAQPMAAAQPAAPAGGVPYPGYPYGQYTQPGQAVNAAQPAQQQYAYNYTYAQPQAGQPQYGGVPVSANPGAQ